MVTSKKVNLFGVDHLEGKQQQDSLKAVSSTVYIVSKEQVIVTLNIFSFAFEVRGSINLKETHKVCILPMYISKYLDRRLHLKHDWLLFKYFQNCRTQTQDLLILKG